MLLLHWGCCWSRCPSTIVPPPKDRLCLDVKIFVQLLEVLETLISPNFSTKSRVPHIQQLSVALGQNKQCSEYRSLHRELALVLVSPEVQSVQQEVLGSSRKPVWNEGLGILALDVKDMVVEDEPVANALNFGCWYGRRTLASSLTNCYHCKAASHCMHSLALTLGGLGARFRYRYSYISRTLAIARGQHVDEKWSMWP